MSGAFVELSHREVLKITMGVLLPLLRVHFRNCNDAVMTNICEIAIVGGGLAGLAAAKALATFGFQAEIFERAPTLGEIGAGINTSPQASKVLAAIGLGD